MLNRELKESARAEWLARASAADTTHKWGKAAEKLRAMEAYRSVSNVFAAPHESLHQARINCLADGKNLIMPAPSLREGFFLLEARTVPFRDMPAAASYKGLEKFGKILKNTGTLSTELLLTDSLAVDCEGGRLGDGNGFFDLCCALLQELDLLADTPSFLTFIQDEQVSPELLPQDKWDIRMSGAVTPERVIEFPPSPQKPQIAWDMLTAKRIKRIDPLWKLKKKVEGKYRGK